MVNKCSAFGCKSGYKTQSLHTGEKITFHSYPLHNKALCDKWIKANPRRNFVPTKYSRICSLHFKPSDFVAESKDSNTTRQKRQSAVSGKLTQRYLREDAVHSIFAAAPSYLSAKKKSPRRNRQSVSSARQQQQQRQLKNLEELFRASDDISSLTLEDICGKLHKETSAPQGYTILVQSDILLMLLIVVTDDLVPEVKSSISLTRQLTCVVSVDGKIMHASAYADLVNGPISQLSQLVNLMARVKSWGEDSAARPLSAHVGAAVQSLEAGLEQLEDRECVECRKIHFIVEQLRLLMKQKYGRHYSPQLTIVAYLIYSSSPAAYDVLYEENVLCLPSTSTLKKVTRRVGGRQGLDNSAYLKMRALKLNEYQKNVLLIIDEIYVAKRVEYSGGEVQGLTTEGAVASTLLCFMVKSLTGKYKDIVALYPVLTLTAVKLYDCYKDVMSLLKGVSFNVIALSVDNASTNRNFFTDCLCDGALKTHITDSETNRPLFLLFDPVHDIKNVYNNFQSRKVFQCPPFERNLPSGCCANFQHVTELYKLEEFASLKKAHKLSPSVLEPKGIEKTSVKLAAAVFCDSTRDAMRFYAENEGQVSWTGTGDFIALILKLWHIMNVKSTAKGKHKRDITMDPVRSCKDWKLDFLREFAEFLQRWEDSKKPGLTRETFLALRHTCLTLAECATFLMDQLGFKYVLLGHLQSDAIESRFGWFRQLSGANYFISTRQVMESDRKIRALSLVKFSGFSLAEIDSVLDDAGPSSQVCEDSVADDIVDSLQYRHTPSASDCNVIYYVSGAIAKSVVRTTKCDDCREMLISSDLLDPVHIDESLDYSAAEFLNNINRGGLMKPSDITYNIVLRCWRVYEEIKHSPDLNRQLLSATSHRLLFEKVMDRAFGSVITTVDDVAANQPFCTKGHDLKEFLVRKFFNCVAKNLVKEITSKAIWQTKQSSKKRKSDKLSSKSR